MQVQAGSAMARARASLSNQQPVWASVGYSWEHELPPACASALLTVNELPSPAGTRGITTANTAAIMSFREVSVISRRCVMALSIAHRLIQICWRGYFMMVGSGATGE